jgi:hypothetical protein
MGVSDAPAAVIEELLQHATSMLPLSEQVVLLLQLQLLPCWQRQER